MSSEEFTIYHNPRCSKSRQTLTLLQENDVEPTIVEYLINPPDAATIQHLLSLLKLTPRELLRSKESAYEEAGLHDQALSDETIIRAMVDNPILIERPIVVRGNEAVIGRPPENVLELL